MADTRVQSLFPLARIDPTSLSVTPVEIMFKEKIIALGTGVIWERKGKNYIITNWHNVSGKNPFDFSLIDKERAYIPDSIQIYLPFIIRHNGVISGQRVQHKIALYENFNDPLWLQHPSFEEKRIDVVAIRIDGHNNTSELISAQMSPTLKELVSLVGSDLMIIGYPFSNYKMPLMLPIWKRGSIATEPLDKWEGRPAFLVDAATRKGMSGSLALRRVEGTAPVAEEDGSLIFDGMNLLSSRILGIYSGRLSAQMDEIALGIVWHAYCVDEIIDAEKHGCRH